MATKLGAAYSLHKPFRPKDLLRVVEACLGNGDPSRQPKPASEIRLQVRRLDAESSAGADPMGRGPFAPSRCTTMCPDMLGSLTKCHRKSTGSLLVSGTLIR
jgi:hypothetical protein